MKDINALKLRCKILDSTETRFIDVIFWNDMKQQVQERINVNDGINIYDARIGVFRDTVQFTIDSPFQHDVSL